MLYITIELTLEPIFISAITSVLCSRHS